MSRVIGIDPGTTTVGYACVEKIGQQFQILDFGVITTTPKLDIGKKLLEIGRDVAELIQKYNPDAVSVEKLYFTTNLKTGIDVAQARGVILYEVGKASIPYLEYTPLQVKKAITGNGQAEKKQLQRAVQMIFRLDSLPKPDDAADAIGLAYMGTLNIKNIS